MRSQLVNPPILHRNSGYWQQRAVGDFRPPPAILTAYLKSDTWFAIRDKYKAMGLPRVCLICGDKNYCLHHTNYRKLGREHPMSLRPLCEPHHKELHQTLNRFAFMLSQTDKALAMIARDVDLEGYMRRSEPWRDNQFLAKRRANLRT